MVYSRLGDLLHARNLTVDDLQRQITERFGRRVNARTLDRLARAERVRRPDLELAAAAAEALDVSLNDVFAVETTAVDDVAYEEDILDPAQSQRLQKLFDLQDRRALSEDEQAEVRALVVDYGRRVSEQGVRGIAAKRGLPVDQVRAEVTLASDHQHLSCRAYYLGEPVGGVRPGAFARRASAAGTERTRQHRQLCLVLSVL